ncbi:hypothetical protein [Candidatus Poriferisodalis sp.]|uniref:hypothetical protein n=1 Tax=Candidatus Poriferisodalis sp. TaxID=3101277 RepID=UPI003B522FDC
MLRKFVLGTLIALIGAVGGVLAVNAWEQWRADGDAPVRTVGVPTLPSAPAAAHQLDPRTGDLNSRITTAAPQEGVAVPALHPQVQAQGMEIVQVIINEHTDSWMWLGPALAAAQFSFFEDLSGSCASALGCYNHRTGEAWLSLDALRREHESYSPYEGPSSSDIVLHELAHAYTRSTSNGNQLLNQFIIHYAGCRSDRDGLSTDRLAEELLADTMAIAAMRATEDPSGLSLSSLIKTPALAELDYGYFRTGGFDGCLADSRVPDPALLNAIYAATFDCESDHALDVYEANQGPYALTLPSDNEQTILKTCYGVECDAGNDCRGWSETDPRQTAASETIQHRNCADGIVTLPGLGERAGWESSCGRSYVPDDVECVVDLNGNEVNLDYAYVVFAGEISEDGICVGLWCRDQTETFAMVGGACRNRH